MGVLLKFSSAFENGYCLTRGSELWPHLARNEPVHGVAIITGRGLVEWLQVPENLAALPRFLQKQLQLEPNVCRLTSGRYA